MAEKKSLIPFWMYPFSWGMKGKTREVAKAEYELEGYELEIKLVDIYKQSMTEDTYKSKILEIDYNYSLITESEYFRGLANLIKDDKLKAIALTELDYKEGKIEQLAYEKKIATLKGEPWVAVIKMDFQSGKPEEGNFELDWNDEFVKSLEEAGYSAPKPDQIVNLWFMTVCKNVAMEEFGGIGNFDEDVESNLNAQEGDLPKGRKTYQ